ncbi:BTB/POZ domain-containing protein kctd5 [Balamuthia mandrillaris]
MPLPVVVAQLLFWLPHTLKGLDIFLKLKGFKIIPSFKQSEWLEINVGGTVFLTTKRTLLSHKSLFSIMFEAEWTQAAKTPTAVAKEYLTAAKSRFSWRRKQKQQEEEEEAQSKDEQKLMKEQERLDFSKKYYQIRKKSDNSIYIDRHPHYFAPCLNYLRTGKLVLDSNHSLTGILEEAKYYRISSLVRMIVEHQKAQGIDVDQEQEKSEKEGVLLTPASSFFMHSDHPPPYPFSSSSFPSSSSFWQSARWSEALARSQQQQRVLSTQIRMSRRKRQQRLQLREHVKKAAKAAGNQ